MLSTQDSMWSKVLQAKYGEDIVKTPDLLRWGSSKTSSLWWKDICRWVCLTTEKVEIGAVIL
ncbi:hypothetical protein A2U01_0100500 [Trifolium medium]|uniref:Uncharacterized protein n=1 Tax=Trifolium medium TaxID=97028 RepID=A0A392UW65_9FABA|nr:hypothetical protein [Trifolium medium]